MKKTPVLIIILFQIKINNCFAVGSLMINSDWQLPMRVIDSSKTIPDGNATAILGNFIGKYCILPECDSLFVINPLQSLDSIVNKFNGQMSIFNTTCINNDESDSSIGTGINVYYSDKSWRIYSVVPESPAYYAGIVNDDILLAIDSFKTSKMSSRQINYRLRGNFGSIVGLKIRKNDSDTIYSLKKGIFLAANVLPPIVTYDGIGYIRLLSFYKTVSEKMAHYIEELKKRNVAGIVIDVRDNRGGLLNEVIQTSELFLKTNAVIFQTQTKMGVLACKKYKAKRNGWYQKPIVILINKSTSAGAEIFAGSLKMNNKAFLIGEQTSGDGYVHSLFTLNDSLVVKIPTEIVFFSDGTCLNGIGVTPNLKLRSNENKFPTEYSLEHEYCRDIQLRNGIEYIRMIKAK
jgi:C-terminal peptidase prc